MTVVKILSCMSAPEFVGKLFLANDFKGEGWHIVRPDGSRVTHPKDGWRMGWFRPHQVEVIQCNT